MTDDCLSTDAVESALRCSRWHTQRNPITGYTARLFSSLESKWRIVRGEWFPPGTASQKTIRAHRRLYPERYGLDPEAFANPDTEQDQLTLGAWSE